MGKNIDSWRNGKKLCYKCHKYKYPSEFYSNNSKSDGIGTPCKECAKQRGREYSKIYKHRNRKFGEKFGNSSVKSRTH